jgi:hypothetical protein
MRNGVSASNVPATLNVRPSVDWRPGSRQGRCGNFVGILLFVDAAAVRLLASPFPSRLPPPSAYRPFPDAGFIADGTQRPSLSQMSASVTLQHSSENAVQRLATEFHDPALDRHIRSQNRMRSIPCHFSTFLLRAQLIQNAVSHIPRLKQYLLSFPYHVLR